MDDNKPVDKMISQTDGEVIKKIDAQGNQFETTSHHFELDIKTLLPGTSLTVPAYDKDGNLVKEANTEFTENDIKELKSKKIKTIYYTLKSRKKLKSTYKAKIDTDNDIDLDENYIIGQEKLDETLDKVTNLFKTAKKEDKVEMSIVYNIADSFYKSIKEKNTNTLLLLKDKDPQNYLYTNAVNVCLLTLVVANDHMPNDSGIKNIGIAALLHDIGITQLPGELITKPFSKMSKEEKEVYIKHPLMGSNLITKRNKYIGIDKSITNAINQHHEYYNGKGYPNKLSEDSINPLTALITLSDMFDYLTRGNPQLDMDYRDAFIYLFEKKGKQFETKLTEAFIKAVANKLGIKKLFGKEYYLLLNTGEIALVEEENTHSMFKPKLRIIADKSGKKYTKLFRIDLKADIDREIVKAVKIKKKS